MCGISGFNWEDKVLIKQMNQVLEHRGPDGEGIYTNKNISLGHRRLSIIDLSERGKQPMCNEEGTVWITFNGEIYNYNEIRKKLVAKHQFKSDTDTEVIIHAYEEYGEKCLSLFNGDFAFCIYDDNKKQLFLARDRIGVKPLYYYYNGEKFIFASEIKAILECAEVKRELNLEAVNQYFSLRYVAGEKTIFKNIFRVLAGNFIIFNLNNCNLKVNNYWDINFKENDYLSDTNLIKKQLIQHLKDSIQRRLISDVPLGVYLSGGIDSSSIVALMSELKKEQGNKEEIKTFSVGFEKGEHVDELPFAKEVSQMFNTSHKEIFLKAEITKILPKIVWHLDEPLADPALIPVYCLSEKAKKDVTVVLTGDGGDEVFAGYDQYRILTMAQKIKNIPFSNKLSFFMKACPDKVLNKIYKYSSSMGKDSFQKVDSMLTSLKAGNKVKAYYELVSIFNDAERKELLSDSAYHENDYSGLNEQYFNNKTNYLNQLLNFDLKNLLSESFLMKSDRMTLAWGIEGRVPFLDHNLVEFSTKIHPSLKLKGQTTKYILRESLLSVLPKNLLYRKKQTFHVPIENWMTEIDNVLEEKEIKRMGLFNEDFIAKLIQRKNAGNLYYARQKWNLINFKLWYEEYLRI